jgi:hypothetical protein
MKSLILLPLILSIISCSAINTKPSNVTLHENISLSYLKSNNSHIKVKGSLKEDVLLPFGGKASLFSELKESAEKYHYKNILITNTYKKKITDRAIGGFYLMGNAVGIEFIPYNKEIIDRTIGNPKDFSPLEISSAIMWAKELNLDNTSEIAQNQLEKIFNPLRAQIPYLNLIDHFSKKDSADFYLSIAKHHKNAETAIYALKLLDKYSSNRHINGLSNIFKNHENRNVRYAAATTLVKLGEIEIIESRVQLEENKYIKSDLKKLLLNHS